MLSQGEFPVFKGTTILCVRKGSKVAMAGDGQVTMGNTVFKQNANKIRTMFEGKVLAGFAGATADAFTLFEKFEGKLESYRGNMTRAAVDLAKDWRMDKMLRRLEALIVVADRSAKRTPLCFSFSIILVNISKFNISPSS